MDSGGFVVGVDVGTHLGWALVQGDAVLRSGGLDLSPRRGDPSGLRYLRLARWLEAQDWPRPLVLVLEDVRSHQRRDRESGRTFQGTTAAHVYGGLRAIIEAWAAARDVPVHPVGVGSWKSGIGLRGPAAPKEAVMARVRMLGHEAATQDEADAVGIALHGWRALRAAAWRAGMAAPRFAGKRR